MEGRHTLGVFLQLLPLSPCLSQINSKFSIIILITIIAVLDHKLVNRQSEASQRVTSQFHRNRRSREPDLRSSADVGELFVGLRWKVTHQSVSIDRLVQLSAVFSPSPFKTCRCAESTSSFHGGDFGRFGGGPTAIAYLSFCRPFLTYFLIYTKISA